MRREETGILNEEPVWRAAKEEGRGKELQGDLIPMSHWEVDTGLKMEGLLPRGGKGTLMLEPSSCFLVARKSRETQGKQA
jgi:hypothetical protein